MAWQNGRFFLAALLATWTPASSFAGSNFQQGTFTLPSAAPTAQLAQNFLRAALALQGSDRASFEKPVIHKASRGNLAVFQQVVHGLPVLGGRAMIRFDEQGRVRYHKISTLPIPPDFSTQPGLSAQSVAAKFLPGSARSLVKPARLVIWRQNAQPVLAWQLQLPIDWTKKTAWELVVDANSGKVLASRNGLHSAQGHIAQVFTENPVATPDLEQVTLSELPPASLDLSGPLVVSKSCVDKHTCTDGIHWCEFEQRVNANQDGNFLDVVPSDDAKDQTDAYSELSAYYHANKAYAAYRELVDSEEFSIGPGPVTAVANGMDPDYESECDGVSAPMGSQLSPLDNAYFVRADFNFLPGISGAAIVLGQGPDFDYGMDGDVIYHEMGHGLVGELAPDLGYRIEVAHGVDTTPGGLVEGLPDYFSSIITGDPQLGEYVGHGTGGAIRNLENSNACPNELAGESHEDGIIVGGTLWNIRGTLAEEQRLLLDRAVIAAIRTLDWEDGFAEFGEALLAEMSLVFDEPTVSAAQAILTDRGMLGCSDFIRTMAPGDKHRQLWVADLRTGDYSPAPVQFKITLDAEASIITMKGESLYFDPDVPAVVKYKPDEPLVWSNGSDDASTTFTLAVDEPVLGSDAIPLSDLRMEGPFAAGDHYFQIYGLTVLKDVEFVVTAGGGRDGEPPDAGAADASISPDASTSSTDPGGCGCQSSNPSTFWNVLLAALLMLAWRAFPLWRKN